MRLISLAAKLILNKIGKFFTYRLHLTATCILLALAIGSAHADLLDELQNSQKPGNSQSTTPLPAPKETEKNSETNSGLVTTVSSLPKNKDVKFEYRIGPHDVLEIEVFQVDDLKHTARVNSRGYISVPLLGAIKVEGLTVEEAEGFIAAAYAKDYLQDPHVSIFVKEYESQNYTVEGEVKEPGVFPLKGPTTLLQTIAMAKGLEKYADYENIVVFRTYNEDKVVGYIVDLDKMRKGEAEDPFIAKNDLIVVPRSGDKAMIESIANTLRGFIGFGTVHFAP